MNFNIKLCLSKQLGLVIMCFMIGYSAQAACDFNTSQAINVSQDTPASADGTQEYVLFDCDGNLVAGPQATASFPAQPNGCYEVFAVNSCPGPLTGITTAADIAALPTGPGNYASVSTTFTVCDVSMLDACEGGSVTVESEPNYATGISNTQMYVLVCDDVIVATSTGGPTATLGTIPDDGDPMTRPTCTVYAANYCSPGGDAGASAIAAGATWSTVDPTANVDFSVTSAPVVMCVPVPVELLSFTGEAKDAVNVLDWTTATEINNSHFDVERSIDGSNFEFIGKVEGRGNSSVEVDYDFTDTKPAIITYYRLKQFDFDGQYEYSNVIKIQREVKGFSIASVIPSPTTGIATLAFNANRQADVQVSIVDVAGRILSAQTLTTEEGLNQAELDLSNYASGVYFVALQSGDFREVTRIVKQ